VDTPEDVVDLPKIICRYSDRFHRLGEGSHHAGSPLGAWLIVALASRAASGRLREELTAILGVDPGSAASCADRMLGAGHPAVACAVAVWAQAGRDAESLAPFLGSLPASVERGVGIPPQSELDSWARERTSGLIPSFPLLPETRPSLLLANALATKVQWDTPFDTAPATLLGARSEWSRALERVLSATGGPDHVEFIARTRGAGDVAVHSAWSRSFLRVTSVIAAPDVPPREVLAAAHDIATRLAIGAADRFSLHELPLGETSTWRLTEQKVYTKVLDKPAESYSALLPAWDAHSEYDLLDGELGFEQAAQVIGQIGGLPVDDVQAKQSVMGRYTQVGFEAAAVTEMGMRLTGLPPPRKRVVKRHAELRFGHPFAVVATASDNNRGIGPWHGVPVFSAWVAEPMEPIAEAG